jgi:hypothetical protein
MDGGNELSYNTDAHFAMQISTANATVSRKQRKALKARTPCSQILETHHSHPPARGERPWYEELSVQPGRDWGSQTYTQCWVYFTVSLKRCNPAASGVLMNQAIYIAAASSKPPTFSLLPSALTLHIVSFNTQQPNSHTAQTQHKRPSAHPWALHPSSRGGARIWCISDCVQNADLPFGILQSCSSE